MEAKALEVVEVDRMNGQSLLVVFSDDTVAQYTVEELVGLRPHRETPENLDGMG